MSTARAWRFFYGKMEKKMSTNANSEEMKNQILGIEEVASTEKMQTKTDWLAANVIWGVYNRKNKVDFTFNGLMAAALMSAADKRAALAGTKKIESKTSDFVFTRK